MHQFHLASTWLLAAASFAPSPFLAEAPPSEDPFLAADLASDESSAAPESVEATAESPFPSSSSAGVGPCSASYSLSAVSRLYLQQEKGRE